MAFGTGKENTNTGNSGGGFKRYVGVGAVKVLAVNPTMAEWNEITGGNMQKEPEYVTTNNEGIKQARVTILCETDPKRTIGDIQAIIPVTFWLRKAPIQGSQSGKYQVIDKYGRTAWATKEDIEAKRIPQYTNGPANIDADYRRIVQGEEALTNFLKAHIGIPALSYVQNGVVKTHPNPKECEARLDNIIKVFEGDFSEIKSIIALQPNNYSKMLFGVKTTEDGKEYQDVLMECFLSNQNPNNTRFAKALADVVKGGRHTYDNTYFGDFNQNGELITLDLRERVVTPTTFTEGAAAAPAAQQPADGGDNPDTTFDAGNDDLPF